MSDSLGRIDDADTKRIKSILARSVDVITAARQDLGEHQRLGDNRLSTELPKREVSSQLANQQQMTSAQRRARLRQLLRNPNPANLTTLSHKAARILRVDPTNAEQISERVGAKNSFEIPKRQSGHRGQQPFDADFQRANAEKLSRREPINRHRNCRGKEKAAPRSLPNICLSTLMRWTRRLDSITNEVIAVLAIALAILLFIRAGPADPHPKALSLVANARTSLAQQTISLEPRASPYRAQGFNVLPREFPEPLPAFTADISGLLFLAAPLLASAPGITVLPYTGLPPALSAFPEDIAQLIMLASSPGPDGRDYLIRTLAFEASGETEIGKVAVAYVILNRMRSGRWGRKLADVVTSPWQFEPWMTRKNEMEGLSRTDPRYLRAAEIADAVLAGRIPDPTAGATYFLNPVIVRERRGGFLPSWADGNGQPIGRHVFYCPECDGTRPKGAAVGEPAEAKRGFATPPVAADRVKSPRVGQAAEAEAPANVVAAKAAPPALRLPDDNPEVRSKPKLEAKHLQADLPWLNQSQVGQRRDFVPYTFW